MFCVCLITLSYKLYSQSNLVPEKSNSRQIGFRVWLGSLCFLIDPFLKMIQALEKDMLENGTFNIYNKCFWLLVKAFFNDSIEMKFWEISLYSWINQELASFYNSFCITFLNWINKTGDLEQNFWWDSVEIPQQQKTWKLCTQLSLVILMLIFAWDCCRYWVCSIFCVSVCLVPICFCFMLIVTVYRL